MKAIILVAGYATRLYPLTLNKPKALLPINDKPIIDYIVDEVNTIDVIDHIYVVSNAKFYDAFYKWSKEVETIIPLTVLNDGTTSEETRLGGIGDILFTINNCGINEDIVVIAGDNFFTYKLKEFYDYFNQSKADCVCAKKLEDKEVLKGFAVAKIDENNKLIELEEKPKEPQSDLGVYATYFYTKDTVGLFKQYIEEGNNPDAPGYFVQWLYKKKDTYVYEMNGDCFDIGTPKSYDEIQKLYNK